MYRDHMHHIKLTGIICFTTQSVSFESHWSSFKFVIGSNRLCIWKLWKDQARSQKRNRKQSSPLPCPPFPLEVNPSPDCGKRVWGSTEAPPAGLGGARPPNAFGTFGLSKTCLVTTSLVLLCDRVTCSITGHRGGSCLLVPQCSYGPED